MAVINGETVQTAGKTLLEYLEEAGYESSRVVVERNLEIVPQDQLGAVMIQDDDAIEVLPVCGRRLKHGSITGERDTATGIDPRDYAGEDFQRGTGSGL